MGLSPNTFPIRNTYAMWWFFGGLIIYLNGVRIFINRKIK